MKSRERETEQHSCVESVSDSVVCSTLTIYFEPGALCVQHTDRRRSSQFANVISYPFAIFVEPANGHIFRFSCSLLSLLQQKITCVQMGEHEMKENHSPFCVHNLHERCVMLRDEHALLGANKIIIQSA